MVERIDVTRLDNGIRVVSETVPYVQSVSVGLWVGAGSRDETAAVRGITHFIEHMLFKGTERRTSRQIAEEVESRGGTLNAFTDKEYTCFYGRSLAEHVDIVVDVLSDMLCRSTLTPDELAHERNVVLEEIKRYRDTPEDIIHDLFTQTLWSAHPLGRPVIGSARTVSSLEPDDLREYMATHYTPDCIVLAAAGNVPHQRLVDLVATHLGGLAGSPFHRRPRHAVPSGRSRAIRKRSEQVQFCLGGPGYRYDEDNRYVLSVIDSVLGGTMSSRLFQEIREKRGLAYSIGSYAVCYAEGGMFVVHGGTSPETYEQVLDLTRREIDRVRCHGLTAEEIARTRMQLRGNLMLGLEGMSARMLRMGKMMLHFDRVLPMEEVLAKVDAVTEDDILRVGARLFDADTLTLASIGPSVR